MEDVEWHPINWRKLERRLYKLQGFKDSHRLHQSKHIAWVWVGNAVPPIVSEALAAEFAGVCQFTLERRVILELVQCNST